ncbi:MAG: tRNA (guanosine(46)-N7)-methyltransferase TrmB [Candidatus Cloacimonetes bacterium]|jgi:tRNA (guanine-N7-)-methyltransferase|nr:tRNA (guanosine(46)-N7)-methyltransferase TrmB [Candidatus Cloacimonadota bacterium]MBT4575625.1 tRNA (guanosine(46)-N7)-methyltransferase TrmB [Candidatus Cloacimonadota bacterium]
MLTDKEILEKSRNFFELKVEENKVLDFNEIFGNDQPVHIEIGSGRGEFLLRTAQQNPHINYIGIDLKEKRVKTLFRKLFKEDFKNVRIAKIYLDEENIKFIPPNSIEKIHLQHPDPWPKKRHFHRRIIQHSFIDIMHKLLSKNGIVDIATDHEDYAFWIVEHFMERDDFVSEYKKGFTREAEDGHIETYFEKKKREEGFEPYFMKYRSR